MTAVRIYHNPRCSKSRAALALLAQRGVACDVIEYLRHPLPIAELQALQAMLGVPVSAMLRRSEGAYEDLGLAGADDMTLLAALAAHPALLERPIVVKDGRGVIARPPERLLALLDD